MASQTQIVHLVYIHGFQGDHTTFQSFPTDLHNELQRRLLSTHPTVQLKSSLYPTYKSKRPLSEATSNFLAWLSSQEPALVILMGHSMGGLLASEAATTSKNSKQKIVGLVAFDTPFLGMHPHVVISGIASLFPQDDDSVPTKPEREMNAGGKVNIVSENEVKRSQTLLSATSSTTVDSSTSLTVPPALKRNESDDWEEFKSRSDSSLPLARSPSPTVEPSFMDKTVTFFTKHSDDRFVKFITKHKDDPLGAMKKWVVERFQFGVLMFEPASLLERYRVLEKWDGLWINYWTSTVAGESKSQAEGANDSTAQMTMDEHGDLQAASEPKVTKSPAGSLRSPDWPTGPPTKSEHKALVNELRSEAKSLEKQQKELNKRNNKHIKGHHFITLPPSNSTTAAALYLSNSGSGSKWEMVNVRGVEDEVAAHCGIFIKSQNLDYEVYVARVVERLDSWIGTMCKQ